MYPGSLVHSPYPPFITDPVTVVDTTATGYGW
jgi:hypothetical protein